MAERDLRQAAGAQVMLLEGKSGPTAAFFVWETSVVGHKRLHMRTEQLRAASSLSHSRQLSGHDNPQEKDT